MPPSSLPLPLQNIFKGSCNFGSSEGSFVAAAQTMGGYSYGLCVPRPTRAAGTSLTSLPLPPASSTGECGQCFEVMCVNGRTRGLPWSLLGPWPGCLPGDAGTKSVVVMVTDSCPCHHPNPSNRRWCCGDAQHFDMSYAAFDAIADRGRGVVDLKVKSCGCEHHGSVITYTAQSPPPSPSPPPHSG